MPDKILFLKLGDFSLINGSIAKILNSEFEDAHIEIVDVKNIWKENLKSQDLINKKYNTLIINKIDTKAYCFYPHNK